MRITAYIIETHMFMWLPALCPPVVIITAGSGTDWGSEAQLCTLYKTAARCKVHSPAETPHMTTGTDVWTGWK